jgi:hypothetical protein
VPAADRVAALSVQLIDVHQALRERLASLRAEPAALVRELDGLTAILESHFGFEERRIAAALDTLGTGAWSAEVFAPG